MHATAHSSFVYNSISSTSIELVPDMSGLRRFIMRGLVPAFESSMLARQAAPAVASGSLGAVERLLGNASGTYRGIQGAKAFHSVRLRPLGAQLNPHSQSVPGASCACIVFCLWQRVS